LFEHAQPMDFGIGYRWRSHESNLLLSIRSASDGPGAVETTSSSPAEDAPPRPPRTRRPSAPEQVQQPRGFWIWR
jgi:hypothetical protein